MTFISDRSARRASDPASGWNLAIEDDGITYTDFILTNEASPAIRFQTVRTSTRNTGKMNSIGIPETHVVMRVKWINGHLPTNARVEERLLIERALKGFGYYFDEPCGPVDVIFDPEN